MNQVALFNAYPVLVALSGFVIAIVLSRRAVSLVRRRPQAFLPHSRLRSRLLVLLEVAVLFAFAIWRSPIGWVALACIYVALGAWSTLRLQRLHLPVAASQLLLIGNWSAVLGVVACGVIFCLRSSL
jgi:hypothetical protein